MLDIACSERREWIDDENEKNTVPASGLEMRSMFVLGLGLALRSRAQLSSFDSSREFCQQILWSTRTSTAVSNAIRLAFSIGIN